VEQSKLDELAELRAILAGYDIPVMILKAIRAAATEAIDAYGTDAYNGKLEGVFQLTANLMAEENYTDEMDEYDFTDEPLFESDEPVSILPEVLPDNVILFPGFGK
jgi:hypothetical protein